MPVLFLVYYHVHYSYNCFVPLDVTVALCRIKWRSLFRKLLKSSWTSVLGHGRSGEVQNSNTKLLQRSPGCHFGLVFLHIWFHYLIHSSLGYLILIGQSSAGRYFVCIMTNKFNDCPRHSYIAVRVSCLSDLSEVYLFIISLY